MMKNELGIEAPLVHRKKEKACFLFLRRMSGSEVRKARRQRLLSLSKDAGGTSRKIKSGFVRSAVYFCAWLTLAVLLFMIGYILVKGVPFLRADLFSWKYTSENCSVVPGLVTRRIGK